MMKKEIESVCRGKTTGLQRDDNGSANGATTKDLPSQVRLLWQAGGVPYPPVFAKECGTN
jgi:hypothetical protein